MPDVITLRDSDDSDDDAPLVANCRGRGPNADTTRTIPEDWVESRIALTLAQLQSSQRNITRGIHPEHVMRLQATTHTQHARKARRIDSEHLQDAIAMNGYRDESNSIIVRALPPSGELAVMPDTADGLHSQRYELLDGHHRVAALEALRARGNLGAGTTDPVTVLRQSTQEQTILFNII